MEILMWALGTLVALYFVVRLTMRHYFPPDT
jgi:hypothetical protein